MQKSCIRRNARYLYDAADPYPEMLLFTLWSAVRNQLVKHEAKQVSMVLTIGYYMCVF